MDALDTVFRHLGHWRHLPAYQLERRADVFFSVYLKEVMEEEFTGTEIEEVMIPEFPIKHDGTRQSDKVDYVLFAKDRSRVFFVELKTDMRSRRDSQDAYLQRAASRGFRHVLDGLRTIKLGTKEYRKYHHLAEALARLGYLHLPVGLADHIWPRARPGLGKLLMQIQVAPVESAIEVVYIQPTADRGSAPGGVLPHPARCIDFEGFAKHVERRDDPFSVRFAAALRDWRTNAASSAPV